MIRGLWRLALRYQNGLFASLFLFALALASFGAGAYVTRFKVFPYPVMREAFAGVRAIHKDLTNTGFDPMLRRDSQFPGDDVAANRIDDPSALTSGLLWAGGEGLFRDVCPVVGCLAVEFASTGEVIHGYPYRLGSLVQAESIVKYPRGSVHPFQAPTILQLPHAVRRYSNGDLLVVFNYRNAEPWKGGVARVDLDGKAIWVRDDYSHHWPTIFTGPDQRELALVPGTTIEELSVEARIGRTVRGADIDCDGQNEIDHLRVLDDQGQVVKDIRIADRIMESPFASMLFLSIEACDLLHLNYVDVIRQDVEGIPDVRPGDYVVSLRNIDTFGILDGSTGAVKRMIRGTFLQQHSVQHLRGSEFLVFDNHGGGSDGGPSRILLVDLADGAVRERTVYPTRDTPKELRLYSQVRGNIAISHDRERLIAAFSNEGVALELRISDGAMLNVYRNVHDLSGLNHNLEAAEGIGVYVLFNDLQYVEGTD